MAITKAIVLSDDGQAMARVYRRLKIHPVESG